jgi:hypothetical protein
MKINHSFQINSLLKMISPSLLGDLFCGGKNYTAETDHRIKLTTIRSMVDRRVLTQGIVIRPTIK